MKVLITGAGGQLGTDLVTHCQEAGDDVVGLARNQLDIADRERVAQAISSARPDVVINAAAWTAVDACEDDPDRAHLINATSVGYVRDACDHVGAHLVHVSTDYVFDGTKAGSYQIEDVPNPQSVYGASKLAGEQAAGADAAIVRTSWVCSAHGGNMVATIARLAGSHPQLSFVADQHGRPTFTADLAVALRNLAHEQATGVWHCANDGATTWFGFAQAVLEALGEDPDRVHPIATADLQPPRPAPRPANSVLDTSRYDAAFEPLPHFRLPLAKAIRAYLLDR